MDIYYNITSMREMIYCIGAVPGNELRAQWYSDLLEHYQQITIGHYRERRLTDLYKNIRAIYRQHLGYILEYRCAYDTGYGYESYGGKNGKWYCKLRRQVIESEPPHHMGIIMRLNPEYFHLNTVSGLHFWCSTSLFSAALYNLLFVQGCSAPYAPVAIQCSQYFHLHSG